MSTLTSSPVKCSSPQKVLPAKPDITGVGITVAYTSTAAVSLALVIVHYIFTYNPERRVRNHTDGPSNASNQSNPIDEYLLYWRLPKFRTSGWFLTHTTNAKGNLHTALVHAMLTMSDFQLITGLTIMISGAIQLPSGITAYHWQRVIRIAWFSCITHLCCLTVLREHFKQNRSLYYWRLPGMVIRVIMLAVGFVPTAQYTWDNESDSSGEQEVALRPFPRDYAICYLGFSQGPNQTESTRYSSSQQRMVLSAVLLLFGMLNRIWHLFDKLTTEFLRVRGFTSSFCKDFLRQMRVWSTADAFWSYLVAVFVYRPCLAIYLTVRILMDMITSRAFEVWWLGLNFAYGAQNLWLRKRLDEPGGQIWSFGQVLALLVLIAPVITAVEGFFQSPARKKLSEVDSSGTEAVQDVLPRPTYRSTGPNFKAHPDELSPDHDFYNYCFIFPQVVYATVVSSAVASSCFLLLLSELRKQPLRIISPVLLSTEGGFLGYGPDSSPPYSLLLGFFALYVLFALTSEMIPPSSKTKRFWIRVPYFVLVTGWLSLVSIGLFLEVVFYLIYAFLVLYFFLSIFHGYQRWRSRA